MDLGLTRPLDKAEATGGSQAKARRLDDDVKKLMTLVAKLSLNSAQSLRVMRSILLKVYLMPSDGDYMKAVVGATTQYTKAAEALRASFDEQGIHKSEQQPKVLDRLGVPHVHAWNALIGITMENIKGKISKKEAVKDLDDLEKAYTHLSEYCKSYQTKGWQAMAEEVKVVMKEKAYGKENLKLIMNVQDPSPSSSVFDIIHALLKATPGTRVLPSVAPAGDMERQIQDWLEKHGAASSSAGHTRATTSSCTECPRTDG